MRGLSSIQPDREIIPLGAFDLFHGHMDLAGFPIASRAVMGSLQTCFSRASKSSHQSCP